MEHPLFSQEETSGIDRAGDGDDTVVRADRGRNERRLAIRALGIASLVLFILGALFYAQHCMQVLANEIRGTVTWSPQLAMMLAFLGLLSQIVLVSLPFKLCMQRPLLRRYSQVEVQAAKVLRREASRREKSTFYKLTVVYACPRDDCYRMTMYYAKQIDVEADEFGQSELRVRVLPAIPTSAISERRYEAEVKPCSKRKCLLYLFSLLAPVLWILNVLYTVDMQIYSSGDFWVKWGLGLLFGDSCIASFCLGYLLILDVNEKMLYGGARPIPTSQLPEGFLDDEEEVEADRPHNDRNILLVEKKASNLSSSQEVV